MRTTIENKKSLSYDLSLDGVNISERRKTETKLTRSCFYDFAMTPGATFVGFSPEKSCGFVKALLEVDVFKKK